MATEILIKPPPPLAEIPEDAFQIKGVWVEVIEPKEGKLVEYKSAGQQLLVRIHKDKEVKEYLQYCYDGGAKRFLDDWIDETLEKFGIMDKKDRHKLFIYKVSIFLPETKPQYKKYTTIQKKEDFKESQTSLEKKIQSIKIQERKIRKEKKRLYKELDEIKEKLAYL